jgi:hypothetical protein
MALQARVSEMNKRAEKVEVAVEELKDSAPSVDNSGVVLETEAVVDGNLHDTSIEVAHEDVPAVAVALLNAEEGGVAAQEGELPPAIKCLGAGVVHGSGDGAVRIHLQFDSGQVLPIEMSHAAALALARGLQGHGGPADPGAPAAAPARAR